VNLLSAAGFTNLGFRYHHRTFSQVDADLNGKTVVITGASGGLGLETAQRLSTLGASVVVVARNQKKLDDAVHKIGRDASGIRADLSLLTEVKALGQQLASGGSINVLINNVGVLFPERGETAEGLEKTLATNLAGHFALTNLLLPRMVQSAPARVINISSGGMYLAKINPSNLQSDRGDYSGAEAYARTKRGQVILTEIWAERLVGTGVTVNSMHPGWVKTEGVRQSLPGFNKVMGPLLRNVEQGADTIVWLAAAEDVANTTGKFWFDRETTDTHVKKSTRETATQRNRLWEQLVEITGTDYPAASR
jgi:dehydrogenase/reductase SDR family member 12